MRYITETGESAVVNERIQTVVGQLPVRLTKQKFFALVGEGMAVYAGSPRKNVEDMLYILRSEALLNQPAGMTLAFPQLAGMLAPFERADYRQMTEAEYSLLSEQMKEAGEILTDYTSELMLLMDLINDLCVVFLSRTGAVMDVAEEERLQAVLRAVREAFSTGAELDAELLRPLEGRQEVCCDQWERYSSPMEISWSRRRRGIPRRRRCAGSACCSRAAPLCRWNPGRRAGIRWTGRSLTGSLRI